ncbi:MAG: epoxyqueuosine reductase QueH [Thermodesulfobacteriota bacterium]
MKLLLHTCCAPCTIYPLRVLRESGADVMGFFYPHNIHPYSECLKRREALADYAAKSDLRVIFPEGYDLEDFIRKMVFREQDRCRFCYYERLRATALLARQVGFDSFSSTLLYSKFQRHDLIREAGEAVAGEIGVRFHYQDFREGWKEGVRVSREIGMYRQQYCGCIYSEKERYCRPQKKTAAPEGI